MIKSSPNSPPPQSSTQQPVKKAKKPAPFSGMVFWPSASRKYNPDITTRFQIRWLIYHRKEIISELVITDWFWLKVNTKYPYSESSGLTITLSLRKNKFCRNLLQISGNYAYLNVALFLNLIYSCVLLLFLKLSIEYIKSLKNSTPPNVSIRGVDIFLNI